MQTPRGVIPKIFDHYAALPLVYDFDASKVEVISDKISRQFVLGGQTMLVKWTLKKGAHIDLHFHANEQITWITEGAVEIHSQGKSFIIKAGQVIIFPAHVPHEFFALEDTIDIDFFTPVRGDWLTNSDDYLRK